MSNGIVWSIAGSDSGGGAGIQADLRTMHDFGVHPCTAITALTAQNSLGVTSIEFCSRKVFQDQLNALNEDLPASVIKIGMIGNRDLIEILADFLAEYRGIVVCDPVMVSTTGARLLEKNAEKDFIERILPYAHLLTPNWHEAALLAGRKVDSLESMAECAETIWQLTGNAILLKGGHGLNGLSHDYLYDKSHQCWFSNLRLENRNTHGTGCTLSSAIASCLALGYSLHDAIVLARMYVHKGIRLGKPFGRGAGPVGHYGFPDSQIDLPVASSYPVNELNSQKFSRFDPGKGIYALIKNHQELQRLLPSGIDIFQLRIKDRPIDEVRSEVAKSVAIAKKAGVQLFINDYWELAIEFHAHGVHLGQEDLSNADVDQLRSKGLQLGISTHNFYEIAIAHQYRPSYIAVGPIYETRTKVVKEPPKGEKMLASVCRMLDYPVVAIGGITLDNLDLLKSCGVAAIALSSALAHKDKAHEPFSFSR